MDANTPLLIAFVGPNGAGKSTLRAVLFQASPIPFVNADEIAAATGLGAYEAAAVAETERQRLFAEGLSFIMETVLSDPIGAKIAFFHEAMASGYRVEVHFVGVSSPTVSMTRVDLRVQAGGHDVPDDKLSTRYPRVMKNLERLIGTVNSLTIYDNTLTSSPYRILAVFAGPDLVALSATLPAWITFLNLPSFTTPATRILP